MTDQRKKEETLKEIWNYSSSLLWLTLKISDIEDSINKQN